MYKATAQESYYILHPDFPTPFVWTEQFVYTHVVEKMVAGSFDNTLYFDNSLYNLLCVHYQKSTAFVLLGRTVKCEDTTMIHVHREV